MFAIVNKCVAGFGLQQFLLFSFLNKTLEQTKNDGLKKEIQIKQEIKNKNSYYSQFGLLLNLIEDSVFVKI